jgi:hypothetical protein
MFVYVNSGFAAAQAEASCALLYCAGSILEDELPPSTRAPENGA